MTFDCLVCLFIVSQLPLCRCLYDNIAGPSPMPSSLYSVNANLSITPYSNTNPPAAQLCHSHVLLTRSTTHVSLETKQDIERSFWYEFDELSFLWRSPSETGKASDESTEMCERWGCFFRTHDIDTSIFSGSSYILPIPAELQMFYLLRIRVKGFH